MKILRILQAIVGMMWFVALGVVLWEHKGLDVVLSVVACVFIGISFLSFATETP